MITFFNKYYLFTFDLDFVEQDRKWLHTLLSWFIDFWHDI